MRAIYNVGNGKSVPPPLPLPLPPPPLSRKEGWATHVARQPSLRPKPPSAADVKRMTVEERARFDGLRRHHHNSFGPVLTPTLSKIVDDLFVRATSNLSTSSGARPGAVLDGYANLGKTTILAHFGRKYEVYLRGQYGVEMEAHLDDEWHPVVYHTLTAQTTLKALYRGIAGFYNAPVAKSATTEQLAETVVDCAQRCATSLFLIDDVHYLDMRHEGARMVNNGMKEIANQTSAMFVYAGIGCLESGLLTEGKTPSKESYGQTRGRFTHIPVEPFGDDTEEDRREWMTLLRSFEKQLVLLNGGDGMLCNSKLAPYLYERTRGYVGSLSNLIRLGATRAMSDGSERLTRKLLDNVKLDHAAETGRAIVAKRSASRRGR